MKIKEPACFDISHWKEVADFSAISPRPFLIITKATEAAPNTGYNHTDSKFVRFFDGMKQAGLRRGCYHFFRKTVDVGKQARHFCDTIRPHINNNDVIVLDIEEGGETAEQIIQFCDYTETAFPDNPFLIYSRKSVLDLVVMTQKQKDRLKRIPTWVAGYPTFPDMLSEVPPWYIPDQNRWGVTWLWQYSESGEVEGIAGAVDLNWIDPVFMAILGEPPEIPNEETMTQYSMTPISGGTRMRTDHNTFANTITSYAANDLIVGDEIWEAPANGSEVMKGDKWLKVLSVNGVNVSVHGWMAYIHKGVPICGNFKMLGVIPPDPIIEYQDVDMQLNIYQGEMTVRINGDEWIKKIL